MTIGIDCIRGVAMRDLYGSGLIGKHFCGLKLIPDELLLSSIGEAVKIRLYSRNYHLTRLGVIHSAFVKGMNQTKSGERTMHLAFTLDKSEYMSLFQFGICA